MEKIVAEVTASVWKVLVQRGDQVDPGQSLIILESMKMEIYIDTEIGGTIVELLVAEGDSVAQGQHLVTVE